METKNDYSDLFIINRAIQKAAAVLERYQNVMVSISGGSDSDTMLDLILKVCPKEKLTFVFFDTGVEYVATKTHLDNLETKYEIKIERVRADVPVPLGCKRYGVPFISKYISEMIERLQKYNFDFANDGRREYDELIIKYPKCLAALCWWCNQHGEKSRFNISKQAAYLKEFMIENPPQFRISNKCCNGAKKSPSHEYKKGKNFDCICLGIRKAEGGIRSQKIKNCYSFDPHEKIQNFRPIFWFKDADKSLYAELYDVQYSDCYTVYGLSRTGCAGCPCNSGFEDEIEIIRRNEPKLYAAANAVFGQSYEYTRKYRDYKKRIKQEAK